MGNMSCVRRTFKIVVQSFISNLGNMLHLSNAVSYKYERKMDEIYLPVPKIYVPVILDFR